MQKSDPIDVAAVVADYCRAWSEADPLARRQLLDRVWAADGSYVDPTAQVVGKIALLDHIGAFLTQFPNAEVVVSSVVDVHHDKLRFAWRLLTPNGKVLLEGTDFGELSADGKLQRIVGFFGPLTLL